MADIATPTGVLLGAFTPGTPEWDEARAGLCITATEIAAVMGLSPWQSCFSLWHKKAGLPTPPFVTNPAVEWGNRLEAAVARKAADEHPELDLQETGTWRHVDRAWQRATPDRIAADRLVECKTSPFGDGWGESGSDEFPIHYRCQVIWQQDTTGLTEPAILAVLIGGWDFREYVIEYDADDAKAMRDAAEVFLDTVRRGERPPIDGADATYQTIRVQHEGLEDVDVQVPLDDAVRYEIAQRQAKSVGLDLTVAKSVLLDHIGTGRRAVVGDRRIAYRTIRADGTTNSLQPYRSTAA
jgi:putative phage-type endonuclease